MVRKSVIALLALTLMPNVACAWYEESLAPGASQGVEILDAAAAPHATERGVTERSLDATPTGQPSATVNRSGSLLRQVGSGTPVRISGRGVGLPLNMAVPMILPRGWKTSFDPAVSDRRTTFSFKQTRWTDALAEMGGQTGTPMTVDWRKGKVLVGEDTSVGTPVPSVSPGTWTGKGGVVKKAVISRAGRADEVARRYKLDVRDFCAWNHVGPAAWLPAGYEVYIEQPPAGTVVVANMPASSSDGRGTLPAQQTTRQPEAGSTAGTATESVQSAGPVISHSGHVYEIGPGPLSRQLMRWCEDAGYRMVWNVSDEYSITTHSSFGGDFHNAVDGLFRSMMDSGYPLRVTIYELNKFVEVTEE